MITDRCRSCWDKLKGDEKEWCRDCELLPKWTYAFVVCPDEDWNHKRSLYRYFAIFRRRTELTFTAPAFERFRSEMGHMGFTLRELARTPLVKWEDAS